MKPSVIPRLGAAAPVIVFLLSATLCLSGTIPGNLVVEGVPEHPPGLVQDVGRYLEFRMATFQSWHPQRREMMVCTRFAETPQLHLVKSPGGARRQITFLSEPVNAGSFQPRHGKYIVYTSDKGGGEFFQLYRLDGDGRSTLLTDGKSRNVGACWSDSGGWIAYSSTRRNGTDTDIYVMDPAKPETDHLVAQMKGGGWAPLDWSPDESALLVSEIISISESRLHLLNLKTGKHTRLTPDGGKDVAWTGGQFRADGKSVITTTDKGAEFRRLVRLDVSGGAMADLTSDVRWDVEAFELSSDGGLLAYSANEDGASALHLLDIGTRLETPVPKLPSGVLAGLKWHSNGRDLGFTLNHANSPADAYSLDVITGEVTRWTESETGGLDAAGFRQPELVRMKTFDGLLVSSLVYRPDPVKFPGKRPAIIVVHGGPEAQSRPIFLGRANYYLDELGVALVVPNVRGSSGYGKTFLSLDNGFKREDSVKDLGAVIDWARAQADIDPARVAVTGGSYGGYMTLAALTHYSDRLKCGVDVVGISNFVTFLKNTHDYRRDLRRVEYGDERDPAMLTHLGRISPTASVGEIRVPLFIVQGKNDPRVPFTEAEQMVKALREKGGTCWYLMASDEGHGFQKKGNADFQFLSTILFWKEHLLDL